MVGVFCPGVLRRLLSGRGGVMVTLSCAAPRVLGDGWGKAKGHYPRRVVSRSRLQSLSGSRCKRLSRRRDGAVIRPETVVRALGIAKAAGEEWQGGRKWSCKVG